MKKEQHINVTLHAPAEPPQTSQQCLHFITFTCDHAQTPEPRTQSENQPNRHIPFSNVPLLPVHETTTTTLAFDCPRICSASVPRRPMAKSGLPLSSVSRSSLLRHHTLRKNRRAKRGWGSRRLKRIVSSVGHQLRSDRETCMYQVSAYHGDLSRLLKVADSSGRMATRQHLDDRTCGPPPLASRNATRLDGLLCFEHNERKIRDEAAFQA